MYRTAVSSPFKSNLTNPFGSDDESCPGLPVPQATASSVRFSHDKYANPFEHESHSSSILTRSTRFIPEHAYNPFDDDNSLTSTEESKKKKLGKSMLFDNHYAFKAASTLPNGHNKSQEDVYTSGRNPFDADADDAENAPAVERHPSSSKTGKSNLMPRATTLSDSAIKVAQKLKDSGVNQVQKLKEGGINQAQRVKETTHKAFKSKDRNTGPRSAGSNELGQHETRELLFEKDGDNHSQKYPSSYGVAPARYNDSFHSGGGLENSSVQELESYAVQKSEETTSRIHNCLKVAEGIKVDATTTLITLHQQGEQIRRTHEVAVEIDYDLTTGEKLLGSLGGMLSRTWKPKKTRPIKGPASIQNDPSIRRAQHLEQRVALGLGASNSNNRAHRDSISTQQSQQLTTQSKLEIEKTKQDEALSDLSNVLSQLKEMSMDMGKEISRQNESLDHLQDDVIELGERVKGANVRGRRLLGK